MTLCELLCTSHGQKVPVTLHSGSWGLGPELDPSCAESDLPRDADVDLPIWAAQRVMQQELATVKLPKHFSKRLADDTEADATCVPVRQLCSRFYDVGKKLEHLVQSDRLSVVWNALRYRYRELLSKAHSAAPSNANGLAFVTHLSVEERALFDRGRASTAAFRAWRYREGERLHQHSTPDIVPASKRMKLSNHTSSIS